MTMDRVFLDASRFRICFVCTGNICRSPMASVVLQRLAEDHGVADRIAVTSAGVSDYHVGEVADERTIAALERRGYAAADHRARAFTRKWFDRFDLVVALDRGQERVLRQMARDDEGAAKVRLLMAFETDPPTLDVPDPYYSEPETFDAVLAQIESACRRLFRQIHPAIAATRHD